MIQRTVTLLTATLAAAVLLSGCVSDTGGASEDGGSKKGKGPDPAAAKALTQRQAQAVLPNAAAVPGWKPLAEPVGIAMDSEAGKRFCPGTYRKGCDGGRFQGLATYFDRSTKTQLDFWLIAYQDEKSAENGNDTLGKYFGPSVGRDPKKIDIGEVGDERFAQRGAMGAAGGPATLAQVRVGATLIWVETSTAGTDTVPDDRVKAFAAMLAERAEQAEQGETPSAGLDG
ncbi:hypothetical protein [Streptomyces sp. NPDC005408]|uniref:hypothetical protein n=1 Tax=Streptomyces sp. NPDC005408 TaxID=3155341 RepID=UPI00339EF9BA